MAIVTKLRASNSKGQFILPAIPAATTPTLVALIDEYRIGFRAVDEGEQPRWEAAALQIHHFAPASFSDLAAKMIVATHYRDPGCDGDALAINVPGTEADRLAVELHLGSLDWLIAQALPPDTAEGDPVTGAWASFKSAFKPSAGLSADEDEQRYNDLSDDADEILASEPAKNLAGVAAKLRRGFIETTTDRWAERLAIGEDTPANRRGLELSDLHTRMAWSAVDDLERLAARAYSRRSNGEGDYPVSNSPIGTEGQP